MYFYEKYAKIKSEEATVELFSTVRFIACTGERMSTVKVKAYAKINLTLEIVGVEAGFHLLDSLVASVDLFDYIVLKKRKDKLSSITMHGLGSEAIPPEQNNALKAAERFSQIFGVNGADITVYKNIPMGAGLGGSSADASGVLNGMAKLYNVTDEVAIDNLADELGSDVKYMRKGGFARMQGRGTTLSPLAIDKTLYFLALLPNASVNTGACYREYDASPLNKDAKNATENAIATLNKKGAEALEELGRYLTNDLFLPATRLNEQVKIAYEEALSFSPLGAVMTGSGSCVLALFETRELCEWAKSRYKGKCRAVVVKTIQPKAIEKKVWKNPFVLSQNETEMIDES